MTTSGQTGQEASLPAATTLPSDRLRAIVEHQPACLAEVTADGRVLAMNDAQVALMGSHGGGRSYHDLVSLTDRERVSDFIREVTEGNRGALEYLIVTPDAGSCDVVTDGVPLDRGADHGVVALLVTRDLTEFRDLERQVQQEAADRVRERTELEARIQSAEERAASAAPERDADGGSDEDVRGRTDLETQVQAAEQRASAALAERDAERERVEEMTRAHVQHSVELAERIEVAEKQTQAALAERDAERERVEQVTQEYATQRAALEAQLEAAAERERASVAERAAERKRVAQALERARVQLLEMKNLREQAATSGRELPGGLPVGEAANPEHAAIMA